MKRKFIVDDSDRRGYLKAIDPVTGQAKWEIPFKSPNIAGTLVTAGGLVFTGQLTGEFMAIDIEDGKILWQFQMPSGIVGQPITWERNGKQYVTVTSGIGGVYALKSGDPISQAFQPAVRSGRSSSSMTEADVPDEAAGARWLGFVLGGDAEVVWATSCGNVFLSRYYSRQWQLSPTVHRPPIRQRPRRGR